MLLADSDSRSSSSPETVDGDDEPRTEDLSVDGSTYDIDAEITFAHPELVLSSTRSACPGATFRIDFQGTTDSADEFLHVSVVDVDVDCLLGALRRDPTVTDPQLVATFDTETILRVRPTAAARRILSLVVDVGGYVRDVRGDLDGWTIRMHLPTRGGLERLNDDCRASDVEVHVVRLTDLQAADAPGVRVLTDDQRELLTAAVDRGYFETPRRISQRELAMAFDVSPSAISQRLRAAMGKIAAHALSVD